MGDHGQQGDHDHDHDHGHQVRSDSSRPHLIAALALLGAFTLGEAIAAWLTNSLALLSDAFHMLSDVAALAAALWALRIAARPESDRMTFGWRRAEILSAAINGVTLIVVGLFLAFEAISRLVHPPEVSAGPVLVVALVGVAVNLAATAILARANRQSLNVEGAYQHILTDLFGFIGTVAAAIVILTTGWMRADAVATLVVCVLMLRAGWSLVRASGWIFLEASPSGIDLADVRAHLLALDDVVDVHDLHVWQVSDTLPIVSAHIAVRDSCFETGHAAEILVNLGDCLRGHFDVAHSTFQLEPERLAGHEVVAH